MMRILFMIVLFFSGLRFMKAQDLNSKKINAISFSSVQIDTLFQDKISIRAIVKDQDKIWYSGNKNRFWFYDLKLNKKFENKIVEDTLKIEFRSIATTANYIYVKRS